MKLITSLVAVILAFASAAQAWEIEEIGTITGTFAEETFKRPTVIVTNGEDVSPTAFMILTVGNFSSLNLMTGDGNFVIEADFMSHAPGPDTAPVSTSVSYAPDGNTRVWLSEGAPAPLEVTFTTLVIDGEEGQATGSFRGLLCLADGLGAEADPGNCRAIDGKFDTPFFIEE